jgi:site-specific recombinase XerD
MNIHACLCRYFTEYLPAIKGVSPETVKTYKDAFKLFLKFSSRHLSQAISDLRLEDITPTLIFSYLDYLEQKRKNSTRTRNARLIALKSFAKMLRLLYPEHREISEMILPIWKFIFSTLTRRHSS